MEFEHYITKYNVEMPKALYDGFKVAIARYETEQNKRFNAKGIGNIVHFNGDFNYLKNENKDSDGYAEQVYDFMTNMYSFDDDDFHKEPNIIKATAKELGLTQKELAEKMGVSETTVTNWARGATPIPDWANVMLRLLIKERKLNTIINLLKEEIL